jgi:peptide-methionine (S)-S-oxide reductase
MAAPAFASPPTAPATEVAVFSGGCFWGVQAVFEHVNGVVSAESGYTGGANGTADYETVSGGDTGHAESVRVVYDPARVSYAQLLDVFFTVVHDPTQLNRQGPDHGTQYRSAIWYTTPAQQQAAHQFIARLGKSGTFKQPIVTTVKPLGGFYPAESYHQDYYVKHPESAYIIYNDVPKVKALKRQFPALWRDEPVLMAASRKS